MVRFQILLGFNMNIVHKSHQQQQKKDSFSVNLWMNVFLLLPTAPACGLWPVLLITAESDS